MRLTVAIVWAIFIAVLHAIPGSDLPNFNLSNLFQIDKLVHAIVFAIGIYLFAIALVTQQNKNFLSYLIVSFVVYGLILEVLQETIFVERSTDLLDWLADTIGVFIGVLIFNKFPFTTSINSVKKD